MTERDRLWFEVEGVVRHALVKSGHRGDLGTIAGPIATVVLDYLRTTSAPTVEEVAESIKRTGGFVRVGSDEAFIGDRLVPAGTLIDAMLRVWRDESGE